MHRTLPLLRDLPHFLANDIGRLAAHIGVNLVEHQNWNFIHLRQHGLQGQHHPREFAGRSNGPQGTRRLAGIRARIEIPNRVQAGRGNLRGASLRRIPRKSC